MIDYERMQATLPKHKAALTRAVKAGHAEVIAACRAAVKEWDVIGAWPDDWARWQRAIDDTAPSWHAPRPQLEDLREGAR